MIIIGIKNITVSQKKFIDRHWEGMISSGHNSLVMLVASPKNGVKAGIYSFKRAINNELSVSDLTPSACKTSDICKYIPMKKDRKD